MWIKRFKLVANAGEISVNRARFDVMAHVDSKEAEGIGSGINGEVMGPTKSHVGLESGGVSSRCR
jgi:hypothetical protein